MNRLPAHFLLFERRHGGVIGIGLLLTACATILLGGCDQSDTTRPPALMASTDVPIASSATLQTLATLPANRVTQLVATRKSVYALQPEASASVGLLEIVNGRAVPTALTSDAVAKSISLTNVRGRLTAIAADGDRIVFSFSGVDGHKPIAAVGTFNPVDGEIFTTVDTFSLDRIDPDFNSTSARPFLFVEGKTTLVVRVEAGEMRIITINNLRSLQPELAASRIDLAPIQDTVARSAWDFSPAETAGSFYLTDTASRWIRKLDSSGAVHHVARFDDSIRSISPAATDPAGRILVLASDRDGINSALLIQNGDAFKPLAVSGFIASGLDLSTLRIDRLVAIPGRQGEYVCYDSTSGKVLRLTLN